jgi:hypothetical protein
MVTSVIARGRCNLILRSVVSSRSPRVTHSFHYTGAPSTYLYGGAPAPHTNRRKSPKIAPHAAAAVVRSRARRTLAPPGTYSRIGKGNFCTKFRNTGTLSTVLREIAHARKGADNHGEAMHIYVLIIDHSTHTLMRTWVWCAPGAARDDSSPRRPGCRARTTWGIRGIV